MATNGVICPLLIHLALCLVLSALETKFVSQVGIFCIPSQQSMIADDNRRKKLMLPQPKEEKTQVENLKEITRLRRMAPLRGEEVKVRFHLDRRCSSCRRFEHVLVSDIEGF